MVRFYVCELECLVVSFLGRMFSSPVSVAPRAQSPAALKKVLAEKRLNLENSELEENL